MIHTYYRHYDTKNMGGEFYRPEWFSYEKCLDNFFETISDQIKFNIVFDGDKGVLPEKYKEFAIEVRARSDAASFFITCGKILKDIDCGKIKDGDLIYLIENDYLHIKGWDIEVNNLIHTLKENSDNCYISLYDHYDKYLKETLSDIVVTSSRHWRLVPSTCGSFIVTKKLFMDDFDILSTIVGDHNKFLMLGETRNRKVITPMPSLSTHCVSGLLAPIIDWRKIND